MVDGLLEKKIQVKQDTKSVSSSTWNFFDQWQSVGKVVVKTREAGVTTMMMMVVEVVEEVEGRGGECGE